MRPFLLYSLGRVGVFLAVSTVLYALGFRSWALVLVALLVSMPLALVLLRRQRMAFAAAVADRVERRQELRRRLSTETDPSTETDLSTETDPSTQTDLSTETGPGSGDRPPGAA